MFVPPSSIDTTFSSRISGQIHSFLPHTPDPYGQLGHVVADLKQAAALRAAVNRPPDRMLAVAAGRAAEHRAILRCCHGFHADAAGVAASSTASNSPSERPMRIGLTRLFTISMVL